MMLLSSVLFSLMSALIRAVPEVNAYTMVMMRFVVGTVGVVFLFALGVDRMRWTNWTWIVARGVSGGLACVLSYWSIQHLGLAKALMLSYSYVAFAALFAVPILGERLLSRHWMAIGLAMAGVALLCGVQNLSVTLADTAALACGVTSGFAIVALTKSRETDSAANVFWSQSLFGIVVAAWPTYTNWVMPTAPQWGVLLAIGILAMGGQLAMTYAYKYTGAAYG
ncbi:MAG: DMT family transporter, partial [Armatimonadota bacterium]|nr:DMT family transporter [Armatimonadota bacterium]